MELMELDDATRGRLFVLLDALFAICYAVQANWNVMAHAQKPDFVFRAKRTIPFKSAAGRQFSRLLAAEVCGSALIMLDTPCSEVVWRVLATYSIRQFPLHFPSRASPCAITFQLNSNLRYHVSLFTYVKWLIFSSAFPGPGQVCNNNKNLATCDTVRSFVSYLHLRNSTPTWPALLSSSQTANR